MTESLPPAIQTLKVPLLAPTEQLKGAEFADLNTWLKEQMNALPEMKVKKTPLSDKDSWKAVMTPDGQVDSVSSPFFAVEGIDVASNDKSWHQGAVIQRSEFLPTKSGEKAEISAVIILLKDPQNRTFVTMTQEPLADVKRTDTKKEIHPVVRSSIQTSVQKLQLISRSANLGNQYDKALTSILTTIANDRKSTVTDILNATNFSKAPTDGNRIASNVAYGSMDVSDALAKKLETTVPTGRWCTQKELDALVVSGMSNGILNIARSVTEAQARLGK